MFISAISFYLFIGKLFQRGFREDEEGLVQSDNDIEKNIGMFVINNVMLDSFQTSLTGEKHPDIKVIAIVSNAINFQAFFVQLKNVSYLSKESRSKSLILT